jgi:hypothetical protein
VNTLFYCGESVFLALELSFAAMQRTDTNTITSGCWPKVG